MNALVLLIEWLVGCSLVAAIVILSALQSIGGVL